MKIKTFILLFTYLLFPFMGSLLQAECLTFTPGSKARFYLSQTHEFIVESMLDSSYDSQIDVVVDITMVSPNSVEMIFRELRILVNNNRPYYPSTLKYDSNHFEDDSEHPDMANLIGVPLQIVLKTDFKLEGTLDPIKAMNNHFVAALDLDDGEVISISHLITQLTHLQGVDLKEKSRYKASFMPYFKRYDADYKIEKITSNQVRAKYDQKIKLIKGLKVRLYGTASWDLLNPLIQKRSLTCEERYSRKREKSHHVYRLNWESVPLE